jgi:hypothetical protein
VILYNYHNKQTLEQLLRWALGWPHLLPKHEQTTNARIHSFRSTCMTSARVTWVKNWGAVRQCSPFGLWWLLICLGGKANKCTEHPVSRIRSHIAAFEFGPIFPPLRAIVVHQLRPSRDRHRGFIPGSFSKTWDSWGFSKDVWKITFQSPDYQTLVEYLNIF